MHTAKVFTNGGSQAVRLPKDCRFRGKEVYVNRIGDMVILMPKSALLDSFRESLDLFTPDFMEKREQGNPEKRESL
ncbi:MAG TPA: type II toxin-antitoxin system VapB family antitoxin [Planctomycetota bacterium]|nr:type II toxin-antitoxin system VapB family antitoxin [Planctomycetota bacterium]HRR79928.1 type II toxin-antitoxin system VapB family antitoxin [Planctomycetota bacterium]HRT94567.1 type II toxin-antitoxin system VapB family antitoxin [Planctomycetota bacterium]